MNDTEWARVVKVLDTNAMGKVQDLLSPNGLKCEKDLKAALAAETDEKAKAQLDLAQKSFSGLRSAAKDAEAEWKKLQSARKSDQAACADAKAYQLKYARFSGLLDVVHEYALAYACAYLSPEPAAKYKKLRTFVENPRFNADRVTSIAVGTKAKLLAKYELTIVVAFDEYYQQFNKDWEALAKPPARPLSAAPATPPKRS